MSVARALPPQPLRVALIGSPNAGKTTLFNALTGSTAHVGNYPGVTVERRSGMLLGSDRALEILDLPGTYSLHGETPDEQVVTHVLAGSQRGERRPDALIVTLDATTLRRGLGLAREALDQGLPTLIVTTMIDEVKARGGSFDPMHLSRLTGVHVLGVVGHRGVGLDSLRSFLEDPGSWPRPASASFGTPEERFVWVDRICDELACDDLQPNSLTDRIDRVLLHPVSGIAVFLGVMVLLFQSIFAWAVPAMDAVDEIFASLGASSRAILPSGWLTDLWADGVLAGVGSVVIFLPQILILFTALHFLQDIGYMSRAAFVVDRVMGWVGLQGRSFVPLLSCYACAVPGIMAARTIASPRERLATILVAPFMTCSARLPVYTLLIAAFIPATTVMGVGVQGLVMFGLYALGASTAFASAALLNRTLLRGSVSVFYMELPPYRWPTFRLVSRQVWQSASAFLKRAGTIILIASIFLWGLLSFPKAPSDPSLTPAQQARANLEASFAGRIGRAIEPGIAPLGFDWKIGVGLLASLAAREVIISTLAQIYAVSDAEDFAGLRGALESDVDPVTGARAFSLPTALSLLVFFVFALQCTSTIAIMARETGSWRWPALAFGYMLGLAWVGSFITFHVARLFV